MSWLFVTLAVWGLFQGGLDVAMNTQGVTVEQAAGRPLMSRLHGMWSVGGLTGALIGAGAVSAGVGLSTQLAILAPLALVVVEILAAASSPTNGSPRPSRRHASRAATADDHRCGRRTGCGVIRVDAVRRRRRRLVGQLPDLTAGRVRRTRRPRVRRIHPDDGDMRLSGPI